MSTTSDNVGPMRSPENEFWIEVAWGFTIVSVIGIVFGVWWAVGGREDRAYYEVRWDSGDLLCDQFWFGDRHRIHGEPTHARNRLYDAELVTDGSDCVVLMHERDAVGWGYEIKGPRVDEWVARPVKLEHSGAPEVSAQYELRWDPAGYECETFVRTPIHGMVTQDNGLPAWEAAFEDGECVTRIVDREDAIGWTYLVRSSNGLYGQAVEARFVRRLQ